MADESDPPRKQYGFKDREFKRDNPLSSAVPPMPTATELAKLAGPVTRTTPTTSGPKAGDPNDVQVILQQNRVAEEKSGGDEINVSKVSSLRRRDYWLLLAAGYGIIIGGVLVMGPNAMTLSAGLVALIIFTLTLTWVMWQVMGKY